MKELFRHRDPTVIHHYKTLLEVADIPIIVRNEVLQMSGITEIPIPEFYPNICVMNDEDYDRARTILKEAMTEQQTASGEDTACPNCKEPNPGNFEVCYLCGHELELAS